MLAAIGTCTFCINPLQMRASTTFCCRSHVYMHLSGRRARFGNHQASCSSPESIGSGHRSLAVYCCVRAMRLQRASNADIQRDLLPALCGGSSTTRAKIKDARMMFQCRRQNFYATRRSATLMHWAVNVIRTLQQSWRGIASVSVKNKKLGYTVEIARVSGHLVQGHSRLLI